MADCRYEPEDPALMQARYATRLAAFAAERNREWLGKGLRGIEREALRVDRQGVLAQTRHPRALGAALTNPSITMDYSEALIELITPAENDVTTMISRLDAIHRFVQQKIDGEMLWAGSMPCVLPPEPRIPLADFGGSHAARIKYVYRRGLALRYGRRMQCIAGIHYNFSLGDTAFSILQQIDSDTGSMAAYQSRRYFDLMRNFRRYSWLLMYLFGASPALATSFLTGNEALKLEALDSSTAYLPFATSLRMSSLGYRSDAQAGLAPLFNCVESYVDTLSQAVSTPYPPYEAMGVKDTAGEWQQISTNILQIENEYYATIRPKRVTGPDERPLQALGERGVQYVEVRCLDVNPFLPMGIDLCTSRFMELFLIWGLLSASVPATAGEAAECDQNFHDVAQEGRRPGLLLTRHGEKIELARWGLELCDEMAPVAALLDSARGDSAYTDALQAQQAKLREVGLTPSAQVLQQMRERKESFQAFSFRLAREHAAYFRSRPPTADESRRLTEQAAVSMEALAAIERQQTGSFDAYVKRWQVL